MVAAIALLMLTFSCAMFICKPLHPLINRLLSYVGSSKLQMLGLLICLHRCFCTTSLLAECPAAMMCKTNFATCHIYAHATSTELVLLQQLVVHSEAAHQVTTYYTEHGLCTYCSMCMCATIQVQEVCATTRTCHQLLWSMASMHHYCYLYTYCHASHNAWYATADPDKLIHGGGYWNTTLVGETEEQPGQKSQVVIAQLKVQMCRYKA